MKKVAVVICTYNKCEYVVNCIESVLNSNFKDFDLIVVDNASEDDTVEVINNKYSDQLTLLVNDENLGGSGGFHRGMSYAMEKGHYEYIHLLDNDVVVDADAIGKLYEFMEEHTDAGACGSLVLDMDFPDTIWDYGAIINIDNLSFGSIYKKMNINAPLPEFVACDYVAACSAMFRCSALEKVGLIDEDYFIFWDDIAFSWKLRIAGYKIYDYSASRIWTKVGETGRNVSFLIYYHFRNKIHTIAKYCTNKEFDKLADIIVTRIFRVFAVNTKSSNAIYVYFHALNDALNGIRGKAESYILLPNNDPEFEFEGRLKTSKNMLILFSKEFVILEDFIKKIRKQHAGIEIFIFSDGKALPNLPDVTVLDKSPDYNKYDLIIKTCDHILDLPEYDRKLIYCDRYMNQLVNDDDFDLVLNLENQYKFFYTTFYPYVKSKLDALRKQFGHDVP